LRYFKDKIEQSAEKPVSELLLGKPYANVYEMCTMQGTIEFTAFQRF